MFTCSIMQPTYLPWLGYFDLMDQSDYFVFLDSVQFNKRSWQQRNRIKAKTGALWLTEHVISKGLGSQTISQVEIDRSSAFQDQQLKTIFHLYNKAPYFDLFYTELSDILGKSQRYLHELNIELIGWFCEKLGIHCRVIKSSSLEIETHKVNLLIDICQQLGADMYLSPLGSMDYIEANNLFSVSNIKLRYHRFDHPEYSQLNGLFIPYLSTLDLLMNEGTAGLSIIRSGRK